MTKLPAPEDTLRATPGPWTAGSNSFGCWFIYGGHSTEKTSPMGIKHNALVAGGDNARTLKEADAALIAQAPALSERCEELESVLRAVRFNIARAGYADNSIMIEGIDAALSRVTQGQG